jgi:hypothetical protein
MMLLTLHERLALINKGTKHTLGQNSEPHSGEGI